jgi:catalase
MNGHSNGNTNGNTNEAPPGTGYADGFRSYEDDRNASSQDTVYTTSK